MAKNEGVVDRALRVALGLVILSQLFIGAQSWFALIGLLPLVTGLVGFCPLYKVLGVTTCPRRPALR